MAFCENLSAFLTKEGFQPEATEFGLQFKFQGLEFVHFKDDNDELFLNLYPDFIRQFNSLLKPEAQIVPKNGEKLTTELRIFALIKLGIDDSSQIAKFLSYSLTTIYNYRSRVRNNALESKDDFETKVLAL